ncbi:Hypothetical protein SSO1727 [Saccharolobus solfataricus P2]|uniref:Uncharacterized protein n=1 Tax=Saccharolobus solfataricus (strain ATCC 35092 / DSM 1617 / JCM 11322 / P2) TaxID=273057 RepID=Q97XK6_SACS2|nr:type III-B CRISPR module-associated protein Cmr5 [Saccharolobus solfataricus]AAK41926.1 Hypothetical protein SSO1727 [Saccharolobus solfataricus P2]
MSKLDEAVNLAIEFGEKIFRLTEICSSKEFISGFRARAREFPLMVRQMGLIPSLTFLFSKIDDGVLIPWLYYLVKEDVKDTKKICNEVRNEGYTSYLMVNLNSIKRKFYYFRFFDKCIEELGSKSEIPSDFISCVKKDFVSMLNELKSNSKLLAEVEDFVLNFSIELKKIVDGIYGGGT